MRTLPPNQALHFLELAGGSYRPPEIVELQERIAAATAAAEIEVKRTGQIDHMVVRSITQMRLDLDGLCAAWAAGELKPTIHRP